jgi:sigma-B regulation protein RsbU (phosphoserine phosphatase)
MLAAFSFATYTSVVHPIQSGDRLVLYAHGSSEATNIYREKFGCQRLH